MSTERNGLLSLWIFLFVSAVASWTIWLSPFEKEGAFHLTVLGLRFNVPFGLTKLMIGICFPGVLAIFWVFCEGQHEGRKLLSTVLRWHTSLKWYLSALILPWALFWASLAAVLLFFPSSRPRPSPTWFLTNLLLLLPFGPLWEEVAWRGYALRKLQIHYTPLKASLIIGGYWAAWHLPLWWVTVGLNKQTAAPALTAAIISVTAWSVVFAFLYNRSGQSLPVVILLHAAYDSAAGAVFPTVQGGQLHYMGVTAILAVCLAVALGKNMSK